jgi:hypothetical protein
MTSSVRLYSLMLAVAYFATGPAPASDEPTAPTELSKLKREIHSATVYKTATCGCCKAWVQHLRDNGFEVQTHDVDNLDEVKQRLGVPFGMGSCHTAQIGPYFIEGHVPAADIQRLLREQPQAKGLTVPGMPIGSPGMESPSGGTQPYDVLLVAPDGTTKTYAHHQ